MEDARLVATQIFVFVSHPENLGKDESHVDFRIFFKRVGWNHQLGLVNSALLVPPPTAGMIFLAVSITRIHLTEALPGGFWGGNLAAKNEGRFS